MMNSEKARLETSIFKIDTLAEEQIGALGEFVAAKRGKPWRGHAKLTVQAAETEQLSVEPTPEYHPLHGDIIAWPEDKAERTQIAIRLAKVATLHLRS